MIPLRELKDALRIEEDQTATDADLVRLEAAAVAHVERETGRHFGAPEQRTEVLTGAGQTVLWLLDTPRSIESVTLVGTPSGTMSQPVPPEFYTVRGREVVGVGRWGAASWPHQVEVVYTAGYDIVSEARPPGTNGPDDPGEPANVAAPADIRHAVRQLVALWREVGLPVALGTVAPPVPANAQRIIDNWTPRRA